jgi:hypothetical protein
MNILIGDLISTAHKWQGRIGPPGGGVFSTKISSKTPFYSVLVQNFFATTWRTRFMGVRGYPVLDYSESTVNTCLGPRGPLKT